MSEFLVHIFSLQFPNYQYSPPTNTNRPFIVLYFTMLTGFTITFLGLFEDGSGQFNDSYHGMLSLFDATLSIPDFSIFEGHRYQYFGVALLISFIILSFIILLHLFVAKLTVIIDNLKLITNIMCLTLSFLQTIYPSLQRSANERWLRDQVRHVCTSAPC